MASIGFPGASTRKTRIPVGPPNPMDRATVVNISPLNLDEKKHTIQPGRFLVPAGSKENPSVLIVGQSTYWVDRDEDQTFEVANSSIQVAESIVKDYCLGLHEASYSDSVGPGLFWLQGCKFTERVNTPNYEKTIEWVKTEHADKLDFYENAQREWYLRLVNTADGLWAQSSGNPLAISSIMKMAARTLGMTDKEWLKNYQEVAKVICKACGFRAAPEAIICQNCRFILNPDKYKELQGQFAVMPPGVSDFSSALKK